MKRAVCVLSMLVLLLALAIPAAAAEYGVYYDQTERLYTEELERLGTQVLPEFTAKYGIDLRVDVVTGLGSFSSVEEAAAYLYEEYQYGAKTDGHCVSLLVIVREDDTGYALDTWHAYFGGDSEELTTNGPWNISKVYDLMTEEAWSGDITQDALVLEGAVGYFVEGLENFVLAGGVVGSIYNPFEQPEEPAEQEPEIPVTPEEKPEIPEEPPKTEEETAPVKAAVPAFVWVLCGAAIVLGIAIGIVITVILKKRR